MPASMFGLCFDRDVILGSVRAMSSLFLKISVKEFVARGLVHLDDVGAVRRAEADIVEVDQIVVVVGVSRAPSVVEAGVRGGLGDIEDGAHDLGSLFDRRPADNGGGVGKMVQVARAKRDTDRGDQLAIPEARAPIGMRGLVRPLGEGIRKPEVNRNFAQVRKGAERVHRSSPRSGVGP